MNRLQSLTNLGLIISLTLFTIGPVATQSSATNVGLRSVDSNGSKMLIVPDDFQKIQDAINSANSGDTVFVRSGIYYETVILNKSISLLGEGQNSTFIDARQRSDVIALLVGNCDVSGFTIQNGGMAVPANCGISVWNADNNTICNNSIAGNFIGISLGNERRGSMANIIRYNNVTANHYGIFLSHSNENRIYGNVFSRSVWNGVELDWSNENLIYNNTISYNGAYGFEIPVETPGGHNTLYHNNFVNNSLRTAVSPFTVDTWDDGYPSGGNYWSDYNGRDLFNGLFQNLTGSDGVGDTPYAINKNNLDRYPLMTPFNPLRPVVNFTFSPEHPTSGQTVAFNASVRTPSGASVRTYAWDFGDGNTATGSRVKHVYSASGTFTVSLNVTDTRNRWAIVEKSITTEDDLRGFFFRVELAVSGAVTAVSVMVLVLFWRNKRRKAHSSTSGNSVAGRSCCQKTIYPISGFIN
jgi:parallel beta-helix repeat protein